MKPTKLFCTDFVSFERMELDFENGAVLIQGQNKTNEGQENNGSGKSAIEAAVQILTLNNQYIYMDTAKKPMQRKTLVRRGTQKAYLSMEYYCPIRKEALFIERTITKSKSGVQVSINGEIRFAFEDNLADSANKFILDWIGISDSDLSNFFLISSEKYVSFFRSNARSNVELINRFSNASILDSTEDIVKDDVRTLETQLRALELNKSSLEGAILNDKSHLENINSEDFEVNKKSRIESVRVTIQGMNTKITRISSEIATLRQEKKDNVAKLSKAETAVKKVKESLENMASNPFDKEVKEKEGEVESVRGTRNEKSKSLNRSNSELRDIISLIRESENNIAGSITCPKCNHEFVVGDDVDIVEERKAIKEAESLKKVVELDMKAIKAVLAEIDTKIAEAEKELQTCEGKQSQWQQQRRQLSKELDGLETEFNKMKRRDSSIDNEVLDLEGQISNLNRGIKQLNESISEIEREVQDTSYSTQLKESISKNEAKLTLIVGDIEVKEEEIFNTKQWVPLFKKFKFQLAAKPITLIQNQCNSFLAKMKSDLRVKMEGFKVKSDGILSEEITTYIVRESELLPFGSFSRGERARVDIAMILSIQEMINLANPYGGLNFLMIDEILEGTDALGLQLLARSLKDFDFPITITTHVVDREVGVKKLLVVKENGISKINKDDA